MAMREKLGNSARAAEALGQSAALFLLDLDDFDDVNDTYGQAEGDACLQHVASRLIATVGAGGFLAQMGEDEFALLLQGHTRRSLSHVLKGMRLRCPSALTGTRFTSRHPSASRFTATGEGSTLMNLFETPHLLWMKLKLREKVVIAFSGS
jgi:diguanylate cyclase (GGDEF)-like protein